MERTLGLALARLDRARSLTELGWRAYNCVPDGVPQARSRAEEAIEALTREPDTAEVLAIRGGAWCLLAHCLAWTDPVAGSEMARRAVEALEGAAREPAAHRWMRVLHDDCARAHLLLEDREAAAASSRRFLERALGDGERLTGLGLLAEALRLSEHLPEAQRAIDEALSLLRHRTFWLPRLYVTRGLIQRASGRWEEARESLERASAALEAADRVSPPEPYQWTYSYLAEEYQETGQFGKAVDAFRRFLAVCREDDPGRPWALRRLADCHMALGANAEAIVTLIPPHRRRAPLRNAAMRSDSLPTTTHAPARAKASHA